MASRAQLLAGLRTGGPGSPRMDSGEAHLYQQQGQHSPPSRMSPTQLKASAAPFTPTSGHESSDQQHHHQSLEDQMASLQLHQQQQGGANLTQQQIAAAQLQHILRQRQQHQQSHLQSQAQQQMEVLRQQQQQAAVAQHQRMLLGQIQAEYDRQAQVNALREHIELQQAQQNQQQAYSAAEQRQAAQASIQASLRTRQAQQLYAQMLQQQQLAAGGGYAQEEANAEAIQQLQQAQLLQRMQAIQQLQAAAQQQQFALAAQQYAAQTGGAPAADQALFAASNDGGSRRVSNNSPQLNGGSQRRSPTLNELAESKRSVSSADQASSWRSRTATNGSNGKPSIIVDDSASEKSVELPMSRNSSNAGTAGVDTPDTSEDDVGAVDKTQQQKMAPLHVRKQGAAATAAVKQSHPPTSAPRPIAISAAPRTRNFTAEAKAAAGSAGPVLSNQPTRQPRGPPTDFKPVNFQSRISARTRREAMSRLCASPRVASFGGLIGAQQNGAHAEPAQGPGGALGFSVLGAPAKLQSVA